MLQRTNRAAGFIEPCLPSPAKAPPAGPHWLHEIKLFAIPILQNDCVCSHRLDAA
jgi:hypothetical protein